MSDQSVKEAPFDHKYKDETDARIQVLDAETADRTSAPAHGNQELRRTLSSRHISFIGFGGGIGVGLFVGIGQSLAETGPLGILLSFAITGFNVWCVVQSVGEIVTQFPVDASFPGYATRFVDPAVGFTVGWTYWYSMSISVAVEVVAVGLLVGYWTTAISVAVWIAIGLAAIYLFNFLPVRFYGEAEVATASLKVICLVGLFLCSLVITLGGAPDKHRRGFEYWRNPGAMNTFPGIGGSLGRFLAFFDTLTRSAFAYGGTEVIVLTGAEAMNPTKQIPKNVKLFVWRQLFFYIGGALMVGMIVPFNEPGLVSNSGNANSSPWVIAIKTAGIKVLPSIVNACIITSAFSAGNTYLYIASRTVRGLALNGHAPKFLARTTKRGVPIYSVLFTASVGLLAFLSVGSGGAGQAFDWLQALIGLNTLLLWGMLCATFIRFRAAMKKQGRDLTDLHWKGVCQPYAAWFAVVCCSIGFPVFLKGRWNTSDFIAQYISFVVFLLPYVSYKLVVRSKVVPLTEVDLVSGQIQAEHIVEEREPTSKFGKILHRIF